MLNFSVYLTRRVVVMNTYLVMFLKLLGWGGAPFCHSFCHFLYSYLSIPIHCFPAGLDEVQLKRDVKLAGVILMVILI